ncbi:MAG: hypothetical protein WC295_11540 [Methanoregula sp.]|jgi:hypothetical protein|nr:hypothetical protein [Methanoregula sp.]MDD5024311.1 hypothetical protein [Methanoregula sp.]
MTSMACMMEQSMTITCDRQKIQHIREKIHQVFDRDSTMNDTMLLKRYTLSSDGDLVMIV